MTVPPVADASPVAATRTPFGSVAGVATPFVARGDSEARLTVGPATFTTMLAEAVGPTFGGVAES